MGVKCESIILREYKKAKADVAWPMCRPSGIWEKTPDTSPHWKGKLSEKERCGGDVTITVRAVNEPYYGGTSAQLEIEATCSRCRDPYYKGIQYVHNSEIDGYLDITALLNTGEVE